MYNYNTEIQKNTIPAFFSSAVIGWVASGTLLISNGASDGSKVYWCKAFSRPTIDTWRATQGNKNRQFTLVWIWIHFYFLYISVTVKHCNHGKNLIMEVLLQYYLLVE